METATADYAHRFDLPVRIHKRWARMLERRAVRFYIENHLDFTVAEEDLFQEDRNGNEVASFTPQGRLVNLTASEEIENDYHNKLSHDMEFNWTPSEKKGKK